MRAVKLQNKQMNKPRNKIKKIETRREHNREKQTKSRMDKKIEDGYLKNLQINSKKRRL